MSLFQKSNNGVPVGGAPKVWNRVVARPRTGSEHLNVSRNTGHASAKTKNLKRISRDFFEQY